MKNYEEFSKISELSEEDKETINDWKKWMESNVEEEDCQPGVVIKASIIVVCAMILAIIALGAACSNFVAR